MLRRFVRVGPRLPWWVWVIAVVMAVAWSQDRVLEASSALAALVVAVIVVGLVRRLRRDVIVDWRDAEAATAVWLKRAGCRRVSLTGAGADAGIDVTTAEWAVQVKHTAKRVGRPAVQQLVGAALTHGRHAALFSTSGFSGPAVDYAAEHEVALFELGLDGSARRLNRPARLVGKRRRIRS